MIYTHMSLESTVGIAKVGTKSLRATVPEGIVAFLEIKEGDKLQWKMDIKDNVSHFALKAIAGLYEENAFFMRLFNDVGKVIDKLPEDYSELKTNYHELIKQFQEDHKF